MRVFYAVVFIGFTFFAFCNFAHARTVGVVHPTGDESVHVDPGNSFSIEIATPFALTPPPGVQKSVVWKQWSVFLTRTVDGALKSKSRELKYELRFLRIRPDAQNVNYVVTAEVQSWLPPGCYNLQVKGPGFVYSAENSVIIDGTVRKTSIHLNKLGENAWQISPPKGQPNSFYVELVIGSSVDAVSFSLNGIGVSIDHICWASFLQDHNANGWRGSRRLVRLKLSPSGELMVLRAQKRSKSTKQVRILLGAESVRPLEWVSLEAKAPFAPLQTIWQFADGDSDVGQKVTYRWMVTTEAIADVAVFDEYGAVHRANLKRPLRMPLERRFTSCQMAHAEIETISVLDFLLKTCFETFLLLLE